MIKVKTFGEPLQPFKAQRELTELDERVNRFITENGIKRVITVSDSTTSEDGNTCGLIRVLVYEA
jgi:peroxiredoxin